MLRTLLVVAFIAGQAVGGAPVRDAPSTAGARCAISGVISEQGSGRPFARAVVTLQQGGSERRIEAVADAEGRYAFTDIEPGEYALWAAPGERIATHLKQAFGPSAPMTPFSQPAPSVTLKPGDILTEMNIALTRALAIEGRILDPWDEPMANVEVEVIRAGGSRYPTGPVASDDRGEFRAFGLPPGRYRVCARVEAHFARTSDDRLRFVRTCHLASIAESNAADVILDAEDAAGIDIRVQRSGTYAVSGSVLDAAGVLADGASVDAIGDDHWMGAHAIARSGQFVLSGLTPGRYAVWASLGGSDDPFDRRPPAREREFGYAMIDVNAADASGVLLLLSKPVKIPGRVRFEGRAPSPSQLRMSVHAGVAQVPTAWFGSPPVSAVDDDLNFELPGVYRVPLVLLIEGLPEGWVLKSVHFDGKDITNMATDFTAAARERRLDILVTNRVAKPRLRVTDDNGEPVTSYQVVVLPADPARSDGSFFELPKAPSRDGVSRLGARVPGEYLVAAITLEDYRLLDQRERIDALRSVAQPVMLTEGDQQVLELHLTRLPAARR